ncbi:MAG: helix-turn-helix transcriptional regulator [Legionellaceae bacterium]|nr:helix-turn-helix transcriptional regulator [Legionellaceae bacterium]
MSSDANLNQYSASATHIAEIAKSLEAVGIAGLFYMRIYRDGSVINLTSCASWTDFFFERLHAGAYQGEDITKHLFIRPGISLWALNPGNQIWQEGKDKFGYGQGVNVCDTYDNYQEILSLYSTKDNDAINHFYINQTDQLEKIKQDFISKAFDFIQQAEHQRDLDSPQIFFEKKILSDFNNQKKSIITPVNLENAGPYVFHKDTHEPVHLPAQQNLCFKYLMEGKSAKEIARAMGLSPRTVEYYLSIIRQQLGCRSSRELILSYAEQLA